MKGHSFLHVCAHAPARMSVAKANFSTSSIS